MKNPAALCAAVCATLFATGAGAETTRLQTVNLDDRAMSTEGGEARLYYVSDSKRRFCRIEAVHFGETGKAVYVFDFGSKLIAAERREYRYDVPIHVDPKARPSLTEKTTLASPAGRDALTKDFKEYRSFFDPKQLPRCRGH